MSSISFVSWNLQKSAICLVIFSIDIICEAVVYPHIYYTIIYCTFFSIFGALWCKAEFFFLPHFFFSCWRVVISLLIEIKPNYLMWSWYWFDFRNQDIFLNWILEALSLGTKAEAPTVLPCSTVVSKTKKSLILTFLTWEKIYLSVYLLHSESWICN